MNTINIGKEIYDELMRQERSVTWLANKLHTNRAHCYRIFHSISIDSLLLLKISIVLEKNFFDFYVKKFDQSFSLESET